MNKDSPRRLTCASQESECHDLALHDDDPDALTTMIRHIYGFEPEATEGIFTSLRLYTVTDKYNLPDLRAKAAQDVKAQLRARVRSSAFPQILRAIFLETPAHDDELMREAALVCRSNLVPLMQKKGFKETVLDVPELALKLLGLVASE